MKSLILPILALSAGFLSPAMAVNFTGLYSQNFDSMGTAGTAPPTDWNVYGAFTGNSTTWPVSSAIPASGIIGGTATTTLTAATTYTTSSNTNGFNYATTTATGDRAMGTSPTSGPGVAIQFSLTNTSGSSISALQVRYDTRRFTASAAANELPGYWLFYSIDNGGSWINVSATNPTITAVPNSIGVTTQAPATITLGSPLANNGTILFRWVDDNAITYSPDQVIGLDNVSIAAAPTDATKTALFFNGTNQYATMGAATAALGASNFTLECWFQRTGTGTITSTGNGGVTSAIPLVTKGRGEAEGSNVDCNYFLGIDSVSNKLCADFEAQSGVTGITAGQNYPIIGNTVIANNVWYHAAATYNATTFQWNLYLNGVLDGTITNTAGAAPRNDSIQHFGIGSAFTSTGVAAGFFQGTIDEARVWNIARTGSQILGSKDAEITTATTGLLARYGLNENTGASANNSVGVAGAPVGTIVASPVWVSGAPFVANLLPTISLTAPANNSSVLSGTTVSLAATAGDSDGTISKVEFYQGATKLGEDATSPYTLDSVFASVGTFSLTARAIDNNSGTTNSAAITLNVTQNAAPVVSLTAPANNSSLVAPASTTLTASASDSDGIISKVEFFNGAVKLGEDLAAPYSYDWSTIPTGTYTLTAKATDNLGLVTTSTAVTLNVTIPATDPPTVALTSPANNANFVFPATVTVTASAADSDGNVTKVEFFNGATKLGEDTSAPYSFNWSGAAIGDYTLTAKATDDQTATATSAAITIHILANQAPVVAPTSPANNATGIGSSISLDLTSTDPEGAAQTITYYGRRTTPVTPGADFTIATLPDTQYYSENLSNNGRSATYFAQTQWLVDNRNALNLAFVSHMGDIVQNGDAVPAEWTVADTAMKKIEDPVSTLRAYGIPWGAAPGNHDQTVIGSAGGANSYYNQYFGASRYAGRNYWGGSQSPANNHNNYQLFSASGMDFIIIHMEYDTRSKTSYQTVLDWADALMKAYPDRRAIVTSHWIVNTGNPASFSTQGQDIYNDLKDNPNFFLMLCGHVAGEGQRTDTFQGRAVHSVLQDYQGRVNGGDGWLRYFVFSPANNTISAKTYRVSNPVNPAAGTFETDADSQFTLAYNMQTSVTDWISLGTVNIPAGGTTASLPWIGLEAGKDYEWYATANDSVNTTTTATRRFSTTAPAAPQVALTAPADGASVPLNSTVDLTATATDSDGTILKVEFFDGATKLATVSSAPYGYSLVNPAPGSHVLTAVATDNSNLSTLSNLVTINVTNSAPIVTLTDPDEAESFGDAPASTHFEAIASDTDGTISRIEFYANALKVGEVTTPAADGITFIYNWNTGYTGTYLLTVKAYDNFGAVTTSTQVRTLYVTNADNVLPSAAITSPASNAIFATSSPLTITATAVDTDGTISKVEFYQGTTKLGEDTTSPYSFAWIPTLAGNYSLTAVATDNDSGITTSSAVTIAVTSGTARPFFGTLTETFDTMGSGTSFILGWSIKNGNTGSGNSTWTDATGIPGSGANSVASMIATTGTLTYNNTVNGPAATNVNGYNLRGDSDTDRALGTSPTGVTGVAIQAQLTNSSGTGITGLQIGYDIRRYVAVATTNGNAELPGYWFFYSLDGGTTWTNVTPLNPTLANVPNTIGTTNIPVTAVTFSSIWNPGTDLLLRWVDDNAIPTSPDQIHALDNVTMLGISVIGAAPVVQLTSPANNAPANAPAAFSLSANASDADGTISKVEFYAGVTKLGEDTSAPYTYDWTNVVAGTYSLTARATDNDGNLVISSAVSVTSVPPPSSGTITRGPYLNQANQNSIVVRWRSSQSVIGKVRYGTSSTNLNLVQDEATSKTDHEVKLTGLTPYTRYYYSVGSAFDTLTPQAAETTSFSPGAPAPTAADYTFRTSPVPGTAVNTRIWIVGDCGRGTQVQASGRDAYYSYNGSSSYTGSRIPDLNLQMGDNAYNSGTDSEYQSGYFNMYSNIFRKMPQWSCLGNHDANNGSTSTTANFPYFDMFTFPTAGECGGVASGTERYYSFNYGNIHFICLDSQASNTAVDNPATAGTNEDGPMATWLRADLAANTATWTIAFWHHPPYSKGSHDSDTEGQMVNMRTNFNPILETGGVDLLYFGHSHNYERSVLLDGNYGTTGTITTAMKKNSGNGSVNGFTTSGSGTIRNSANGFNATSTVNGTFIPGNGAYIKPLTGPRDRFGAVYNTAGMSGLADTGSINHSAMYICYNSVGTVNLDVNGNTLTSTFVQSGGATPDNFTITKQGAADTDGDGISDAYEIANGLNRYGSDTNTGTDSDGLSNFFEFAFGLNPNVNDSGPVEADVPGGLLTKRGQPAVWYQATNNGTDFRILFTRRKDYQIDGLVYTPEFSGDMSTWVPSPSASPTVIATDGEIELVSIKYPYFAAGKKARFFRMGVSSTH